MTCLDKLIEAVERGEWRANDDDIRPIWRSMSHDDAYAAFNGSLDAARALHKAVLPGWTWELGPFGADLWAPETYDDPATIKVSTAGRENPARAWFLAILRAMKERGQ